METHYGRCAGYEGKKGPHSTKEKGVNSQGRLKAKKVGIERVWREKSTGRYTWYGSSEMPYVGTILVIIIENQKYELIYDQSINIFHGKQ